MSIKKEAQANYLIRTAREIRFNSRGISFIKERAGEFANDFKWIVIDYTTSLDLIIMSDEYEGAIILPYSHIIEYKLTGKKGRNCYEIEVTPKVVGKKYLVFADNARDAKRKAWKIHKTESVSNMETHDIKLIEKIIKLKRK